MDFVIVFLVGFGLLLVTNVLNKFLVDQNEMKAKKERLNQLNKEIKEKQKAGNMVDSKKLLSEVLREQNVIFRASMKPLLYSIGVFIIALNFFLIPNYGDVPVFLEKQGNTYSDELILGDTTFEVQKSSNEITVDSLKCDPSCKMTIIGSSLWNVRFSDKGLKLTDTNNDIPKIEREFFVAEDKDGFNTGLFGLEYHKVIRNENSVIIDDEVSCELPCDQVEIGGRRFSITESESVEFQRVILALPFALPFFGNDLGWLAVYIFLNIPSMIIQKRFLKIYT